MEIEAAVEAAAAAMVDKGDDAARLGEPVSRSLIWGWIRPR